MALKRKRPAGHRPLHAATEQQEQADGPAHRDASRQAGSVWLGEAGWKKVEVGDELLLAAEEGGFLEIEEYVPGCGGDGAAVLGPNLAAAAADEPAQVKAGSERKAKKLSKRQKTGCKLHAKPGPISPEGDWGPATMPGSEEEVSELRRQIRALQQDNERLKLARPSQAAGCSSLQQPDDDLPAQRKDRPRLAGKQQKGKSLQTGNAPAMETVSAKESPEPGADTSAWDGLGLGPELLHALGILGFTQPTPVQEACLPPALRDRRDIIGAAQTGSGKTLAFGLPILQALLAEKDAMGRAGSLGLRKDAAIEVTTDHMESTVETDKGCVPTTELGEQRLRALILVPTRELAIQVSDHLTAVARPCGMRVAPIVGGLAPAKQSRLLRYCPPVVVATPGRLWELMRAGQSHLTRTSGLCSLVLDEADRMVQQGHFEELSSILQYIYSSREDDDGMLRDGQHSGKHSGAWADGLQTFVFSATLMLPNALRKRLRKGGGGASGSATLESLMDKLRFRAKPMIVDLTPARKLADKVAEAVVRCSDAERDDFLYYLLAVHPGRTLVFVNAVSTARRLGGVLKALSLPAVPLHAGMQQRARLKALARFRANPSGVLVATDVAARGLDIPGVRCVVQYQMAASADVYVHRAGRTARGQAEGVCISLITPRDAARFTALLQALKHTSPPDFLVDTAVMPQARARVRLAVRLDALLRQQSKAAAEGAWRLRSAEAAGVDLSSDEEPAGPARLRGAAGGSSTAVVNIQQELAGLLAEPLQARFSRRFFTGAPMSDHHLHQDDPSPHAHVETGTTEEACDEHLDTAEAQCTRAPVELAQRLADSRAAAATSKAARRGAARNALQRRHKQPTQKEVRPVSRYAASQAALLRAATRSKRKTSRGMVVIPPAIARPESGPDALQALRIRQKV